MKSFKVCCKISKTRIKHKRDSTVTVVNKTKVKLILNLKLFSEILKSLSQLIKRQNKY